MSGDLVSLRMLVIGSAGPELDLWRQGAAQASVPIEFAAGDAHHALQMLGRGGVDFCIVDAAIPADDKATVLKAARAAKPPAFVMAAAPGRSARVDGFDGVLAKPTGLNDARLVVEQCVRVKMPTRVLIVDDSGTMRSIVRKILSASRFALDIHEAAEGIAALNQLRSDSFGMVFLDYNMPGLNGFETLAEIKRESPSVAVVMMTSTLDNAIADRAHAAGALAFLKKPFYPVDIDAVLARYYGLHAPLG